MGGSFMDCGRACDRERNTEVSVVRGATVVSEGNISVLCLFGLDLGTSEEEASGGKAFEGAVFEEDDDDEEEEEEGKAGGEE
jgi:hypothetical protein